MRSQPIITGFDTSAEAVDGLALARLLTDLVGGELVVARVFDGEIEHEEPDRRFQRKVRETIGETRRAVVAAIPGVATDVMPVVDLRVSRGLHALAEAREAAFLVLGSTHHGPLGRLLLGSTAEGVINGAPCPVAVAPPGFAADPVLNPLRIGAAYDGSSAAHAALGVATDLAAAARARLQLLAVNAPWWEHPIAGHQHDAGAESRSVLAELPDDVPVDMQVLHGDPAAMLVEATAALVGLMVSGSNAKGPLRRALLGSVSTALVRHAHCPVVVVPRAR